MLDQIEIDIYTSTLDALGDTCGMHAGCSTLVRGLALSAAVGKMYVRCESLLDTLY